MADDGSGVPPWRPPCIANDRAEYVELDAEPGTLALWKLSPRGRVLVSLPCTAAMFSGCMEGLKYDAPASCTEV